MIRLKYIASVVLILVLSGCVLKSDYTARLGDIDNLKKDVSGRDERIKDLESERTALQTELAALKQSHEDLTVRNKALSDDNAGLTNLLKAKKDELSARIAVLRDQISEKELALSVKHTEVVALRQEKEQAVQEKERSIADLKKTYTSLVGEMSEEIKKGEITITQLKDKLSVNMVEKILFDSGSAEIKKDGKKVIDRVAEILAKVMDKQIRVEGYTDNVPISPRLAVKFPTNWELSAARATTVARYLQDKGIDPRLLSAAGYSEYRPVALNDTDEGKARNRRIEISLIPKEVESATQAAAAEQK
jgi:chemotaxis protein MotB